MADTERTEMTRIAYFDCLSGISGDMTLGAFIDLGVDPAAIESAVRSMGLPELSITASTVKKCGFRAVHVKIDHPPEHAHRHLHHITFTYPRRKEGGLQSGRTIANGNPMLNAIVGRKVFFKLTGLDR